MQTTPLINATTKVEHDNAGKCALGLTRSCTCNWHACMCTSYNTCCNTTSHYIQHNVVIRYLMDHTPTTCRAYLPPSFGTVEVTSMSTVIFPWCWPVLTMESWLGRSPPSLMTSSEVLKLNCTTAACINQYSESIMRNLTVGIVYIVLALAVFSKKFEPMHTPL